MALHAGARRKRGDRAFRFTASTFLMPIMAVFIVLFVIPLCQTIYFSFTDFRGFSKHVHFVGLKNYVTIFHSPALTGGLFFTILFAVCTTVLVTVCAIPLAVFLNQKFLGQSFARSLFFFLGVPSAAILGLVWQYVFSPLRSGVLNYALGIFGIQPIGWLSNPTLARLCVILVSVWAALGWHATLYIAYLQAIPSDLYEQAEVDGATGVQRFFHITLPQLIPAVVVSTFLLVAGGLKVYDLPYTMTTGGPGYATNTVTQSIILQGVAQAHYGIGSALAVLFTLITMAIVMSQVAVANKVAQRFE